MNTTDSPSLASPLIEPRELDLAERRSMAERMAEAQAAWLPRLAALVEPPAPEPDFPAFLMEAAAFSELRAAVGQARRAAELAPGVRDQLQWFVDVYRDYLRTTEDESWFVAPQRDCSSPGSRTGASQTPRRHT